MLEFILLLVLCFIAPPIVVAIEYGLSFQLLLNFILLCFGWVPAVIHALIVLLA